MPKSKRALVAPPTPVLEGAAFSAPLPHRDRLAGRRHAGAMSPLAGDHQLSTRNWRPKSLPRALVGSAAQLYKEE